MASKRDFKKELNYIIIDLVEECFNIQMYNPSKTDATNGVIEEVVGFRNELVERIHKAKTKKEFTELRKEGNDRINTLVEKVNSL